MTRKFLSVLLCALLLGSVFLIHRSGVEVSQAQGKAKNQVGPETQVLVKTRNKAIDYLRNTQADNGSWTLPTAPGISALVTFSLVRSGLSVDDPTVQKAIKHLLGFVQKDGGIYYSKSNHRNYETCISLLTFHAVNADGRYDSLIANADQFLRELQWDKGEGLESTDAGFGGAGYGKHERPDLSNTQFLIEALKAAGAKTDDPAIQNALKFVSRTQNLETEFNNTPFSAKIGDGGFYYTPAAGGTSQAGLAANGGLRSYGSMTYAGLKSMVFAGLTSEDPRVKAAFNWIQKNYSVEENPGLGQQGVYYYFHTFAKALSVLDLDFVEDTKGQQHDWRKELAERLAKLQQPSGSWVNRSQRWYEGDPNLATAYALMALSYCDSKPVQK